MTDRELIESLANLSMDPETTEWEDEFLGSMWAKLASKDWKLSPKQRSCAEDLLKKLEAHGSEAAKFTAPPEVKRHLRERKAWED